MHDLSMRFFGLFLTVRVFVWAGVDVRGDEKVGSRFFLSLVLSYRGVQFSKVTDEVATLVSLAKCPESFGGFLLKKDLSVCMAADQKMGT